MATERTLWTTATVIVLWTLCGCRSEGAIRPDKASLSEAIDDWVRLIEADELTKASQRWSQNEETTQQLAKWWDRLKRCHQQFDYKNWSRQAKELEKPKKFTVGGHSYGYMNTVWEQTPEGWRITHVFICR